ncbi:MAG: hypothetical protein O3B83_03600 [Bacteroidetes bacterium]|nr:hypothetical protein [Bacteroidota bacterium]
MSMTEIAWDEKNEVLGVSSRFFIDDMERALSENTPFKITEPMDDAQSSKLRAYFSDHFSIQDAEGPLDLDFLGFELEDDLIWCYAESTRRADEKTVLVRANWLTEVFSAQSNMVHYHTKEGIKTLLLNKEHSSSLVLE